MKTAGKTSAIVLAAGRSSRMGQTKAGLMLGTCSVLERVVQAFTEAMVDDVVVVTGHEPERLAGLLDTLPVRSVHNPDYDTGMFSSVLAGVAALPPDSEAFFIQPVDLPLVTARVFARLRTALTDAAWGIAHPTCCGLRGHPPLLSGRYRELLLEEARDRDLGEFLEDYVTDSREVEVEDLSILLDMDTEADYRRASRFATVDPEGHLSREDSLYLLELLETPDRVREHSLTVSAVSEALASALKPHAPAMDVELTSCAGLLHDLARTFEDHATLGANVLRNLGLHKLATVVAAHMTLPPELLQRDDITEAHLVYLADKLIIDDQVVGIEARAARAHRKLGGSNAEPQALARVDARIAAAQAIQGRVEATLGEPLKETLARAKLWK